MKGCRARCLSRSNPPHPTSHPRPSTPQPHPALAPSWGNHLQHGALCTAGTNSRPVKRPNMRTAFGFLEFPSMTLLSFPREENPEQSPPTGLSVVSWPAEIFSKSQASAVLVARRNTGPDGPLPVRPHCPGLSPHCFHLVVPVCSLGRAGRAPPQGFSTGCFISFNNFPPEYLLASLPHLLPTLLKSHCTMGMAQPPSANQHINSHRHHLLPPHPAWLSGQCLSSS